VAKKKTKKKAGSSEKELKASVKKLRAQLAASEKSAGKWKTRAGSRAAEVAGLKTELKATRRRAKKAEESASTWKQRARSAVTPAVPDAGTPAAPSSTPDETWTVTRLRAEARARGVAGYSRRTKLQLLDDLRG
jgi:peptidoglycan hydrolase CwlO-like protein